MLRGGTIPDRWSLSARFLTLREDGAQHRFTLDYRVTPKFSLGIEHSANQSEFLPRATWFVTPSKGDLPSFTLGFTADRLSTPRGHAVFATFSFSPKGWALRPFASIKYGTANQRFYYPFGANLVLGSDFTFQGLYDGANTHLLLTKSWESASLSLVLARTRSLGVSVSFGF